MDELAGERRRSAVLGAAVTLLLPCWRPDWSFLREAVASVLGQTSPLWELLICCEAGEDEAVRQQVTAWTGADRRVAILVNERKLLSGALNTGMRRAATEFVAILLGDDLLAPEAVAVLGRNILDHPRCDFFHSSRRIIDENGENISPVYPARESFALEEFKRWSPVKHMLCFRREKALEIGGIDENLGLHGADDYDFPWCMAEAGCVFRAVPECLYLYRDHHQHFRLTTHVPLTVQLQELEKIWRKHGMTEEEIRIQSTIRTSGYLRQALSLDWDDTQTKEESGFGVCTG
jgi:glycosyltransferase involved in cell wall biosynthesis